MTYSIVAHDPSSCLWGVAVASKAMCVGAHVPWGQGGRGAVATQAYHDLRYGTEGLMHLQDRARATEVIARLTEGDPESRYRQVGVVDARGDAASFTGPDCMDWAGGFAGAGFAVQGNLLSGPGVVEAMVAGWKATTGAFEQRLMSALLAGDESGGDRRGRQSAAIRVWRHPEDVPAGQSDTSLFLRVDDDPLPVHRLVSLVWRVVEQPDLLCGA